MSRRGGLRKRLTGENDEEYALRRQKNNDAVNRFSFFPFYLSNYFLLKTEWFYILLNILKENAFKLIKY